jgi:hypothetical protein
MLRFCLKCGTINSSLTLQAAPSFAALRRVAFVVRLS